MEVDRKPLNRFPPSTFASTVEDLQSLKKFVILRFKLYDNRTDLARHIRYSMQVMPLWNGNNTNMYRVFPPALLQGSLTNPPNRKRRKMHLLFIHPQEVHYEEEKHRNPKR